MELTDSAIAATVINEANQYLPRPISSTKQPLCVQRMAKRYSLFVSGQKLGFEVICGAKPERTMIPFSSR